MSLRSSLPMSMEDLTNDWEVWSKNSSLNSTLRFGQYVLNKRLGRNWAWPLCYYANTEQAWDLLSKWINESDPKEYPKLVWQ